jgi:hypothetical protein
VYRKRYVRTSAPGVAPSLQKVLILAIHIYLDESGDLGWKFDAPYRRGGSSRYLTISTIIVPSDKKHLPKRLIQRLYKKFKWNPQTEKKWSDMSLSEREHFSKKAKELREQHPDIKYFAMTVYKPNVMEHIRQDGNKLYNYMTGLILLDEMSYHDNVTFIPDPRSMKVESGNSMSDYLQIQLWFEKRSSTQLVTIPADSASNRNVQFSDMLSGVVQGHYEDGNSSPWKVLASAINSKRLYFN